MTRQAGPSTPLPAEPNGPPAPALDPRPSTLNPHSARDRYLDTEITTATPQKLQLMLLDAALRHGRRARDCWGERQDEAAGESLIRCQEIVSSLLGGMNAEHDRDLVRRVSGVYLFIYRTLTAAHFERDRQKLGEALDILEIERETWQLVCQQSGSRTQPSSHIPVGFSFDA